MSATYKAVSWNPFKKSFDRILTGIVLAFIATFVAAGLVAFPAMTVEILLMRALGVCAIVLLHLILIIGPMARISTLWLPLLYNRRHLGVTMFLLALAHAVIAILTYHVGSDMNPILSVILTDAGPSVAEFPFQAAGLAALVILFVMAATSHDFWLSNLTAPVWKALHMSVYVAYFFLILHIAFGILQAETSPIYLILTAAGAVAIGSLHLIAGWSPRQADPPPASNTESFTDICHVSELTENSPRGANVAGERVAVLLYDGNKISCVSGVCQHQNGPLAEGQFIYGCLTCPWHGYQYKPDDGRSPEPFTEKLPTFEVKIENDRVLVHNVPKPAGTKVPPAIISNPPPSSD